MSSSSITLKRTLGPIALIIYGVGDILGAGIYVLTGKVAGIAGDDAWLAFLASMIVASLTAFSYAEFSARHPHSGGAAYFVSRASRRPALPLLIGWLVLCSGTVSMAAGSRGFAGYFCEMVPVLPVNLVVVLFLAATGFVVFWGIRESATLTIICTTATVLGLFIVIATGLAYYWGGGVPVEVVAPAADSEQASFSWMAIAGGAALAFYAFIGFEDLVNVAEEVKAPQRTLPIAILVAVGVTGIIYILVAWVATAVLTPASLAASKAPLLDLVRITAPAVPPLLFSVIALFAVADTALINCVMGSRLLYGLSREGLLPPKLSAVHPKRQTPYVAVLVVLSGALLLAVTGTVGGLAGTTSTLLLLVFACVHTGLLIVKRKEPDYQGFQVPSVVPVLGLITCLALACFAKGLSMTVGIGVIVVGILLVAWRKGWNAKADGSSRNGRD